MHLSPTHDPVKLYILLCVTRHKQPATILVVKQSETHADSLEVMKCQLHKILHHKIFRNVGL